MIDRGKAPHYMYLSITYSTYICCSSLACSTLTSAHLHMRKNEKNLSIELLSLYCSSFGTWGCCDHDILHQEN